MTIDVSKTRELANRIQDELPKLWHKRFLGPGKILSLCILLVGVMVHLQQLVEGLTILARQMQPGRVEEGTKEEPAQSREDTCRKEDRDGVVTE